MPLTLERQRLWQFRLERKHPESTLALELGGSISGTVRNDLGEWEYPVSICKFGNIQPAWGLVVTRHCQTELTRSQACRRVPIA